MQYCFTPGCITASYDTIKSEGRQMKQFLIINSIKWTKNKTIFGLDFMLFCLIRRPSDSTVSEDAGIESRTGATCDFGIGSQTL
jgi:hypothetical protein